jgi:UDP-glucose 4-epimerase
MYKLTSTSLRYSNVYGPRQSPHGEAGVVAIFCARILDGKPLTIYGDGLQTRDYVFVEDVVEANARAFEKRLDGGFNVGGGVETNVIEVAQMLLKISGKNVPINHEPGRPGEQRRSVIDPALLEKATGFRPKTTLEQGLTKTFEFFARQHKTRA